MRIRRDAAPPPYLNRRSQRRLIMLGGLLVLVLVAMKVAAKPQTWAWLFVGRSAQKSDANPAVGQSKSLQPGDFRAANSGTGPVIARKPRHILLLQKPGDSDPATFDPQVNPAAFASIKDRDSLNFEELDGYYAILAKVANAPQRALREAGSDEAPFTVLLNDPDSQRGKIMTLYGKLGRLMKLSGKRESLGLPELYEAWIVTPGSDNNPYRVVISEKPDGLEPTELFEPAVDVRVTGYFFKVQRYTAGDDQPHYAPLLLAKRLHIVTDAERASPGLGVAPYIMGFAIVVGATLAFFMWRFSRGDKEFAEKNLKQYAVAGDTSPQDLKNVELTEEVAAFFQRITEEENAGEQPPENPSV